MYTQRKDVIYLTVNVPNVQNKPSFSLTDEGHLSLSCVGGNLGSEREYKLEIDLFKGVKVDESKMNVTARSVNFKIVKAESGPYWDRLLSKGKDVHCTIDWDNWKDEDEDEDDYAFGSQFTENQDLQDMDFGYNGSSDDSDDEAKDNADAEEIDATKNGEEPASGAAK